MKILCFGQTSVLQDKSGQSTLVLSKSALVALNTGATSIAGSYSQYVSDSIHGEQAWGFNIKFKASNGVSTILSGYDLKPQFDIGGFKVLYLKCKKCTYRFAYLAGTFTFANNSILKTDNSNTFDARKFAGYKINLGYNLLGTIGTAPWLNGFTFGLARLNNINDLKSVQTSQTISTTVNNKQTTLSSGSQSGFSGEYATTNALLLNIDSYCFVLKTRQIGIGGYLRSQLTGIKPRSSAGAGIVFGKKGAPDNITLGLFYQFNDIFHQLDTSNDFIRRGGVNVVAGYSF
jgi:hypothetical protein